MKVNDPDKAKWEELHEDMVSMVYVECPSCGYHMGVDYSYLEQVGPVETLCPACGTECYVEEIE